MEARHAARLSAPPATVRTRRVVPIPERVFAGAVYLPRMRESDTARLPFLGAVRLGVLPGGIVVGQHLVFLHIALAGNITQAPAFSSIGTR